MDPITAISLAGTVVQFVAFGSTLLSHAGELYHSTAGTLTTNQEIELVTADISSVIEKFRQACCSNDSAGPVRREEEEEQDVLQKICEGAQVVAQEILEKLRTLKLNDTKHKKWQSFQAAIKSLWSKQEVADLQKRLERFKEALESRVLLTIKSNLDVESIRVSSRFDSLDHQTQTILSTLSNNNTTQFRDQLDALLQLVHRLDIINADEHRRTREMIVQELRESNPYRLRHEIVAITSSFEMLDVSDAQESLLRTAVNDKILDSLNYPTMTTRYENILEAYPTTFEWAFEESTTKQRPWSNLSEWLKTGQGVYWINGKAGSGKSTLMKHIYDDYRTREYLECWADNGGFSGGNDIPLCIATFYFWNSGLPEQRTQAGLLRALLHQVLMFNENLIPVALPDMWAKIYRNLANPVRNSFSGQSSLLSWTTRQLMTAFRALIHQQEVPIKICFMVDGLDEFEGDLEELSYGELADLFSDIGNAQNVKVCLSSRPLVVFKEKFSTYPGLRLQDLTYSDIELYVKGKFSRSREFDKLALREPEAAPALLRELVDSADGVFLWVRIVVRSLLNGIMNRDDISILVRRLREMPKEFEPLYDHLLRQISPTYSEWASKAFQIVRKAREIVVDPFGRPDQGQDLGGGEALSLLKFHYAMKDGIGFDPPTANCDYESLAGEYQDTAVHLIARCAGFIEVHSKSGYDDDDPERFSHSSVGYMHRTVREYLESRQCWPRILSHTAPEFEPNVALMKGCVHFVFNTDIVTDEMFRHINDAMVHAFHADLDVVSHPLQVRILDQFNWRMTWVHSGWVSRLLSGGLKGPTFLTCAVYFGHTGYVRHKLEQVELGAPEPDTSVLLYELLAVERQSENNRIPPPKSEMVALLLDFGADPNHLPNDDLQVWSTWQAVITQLNQIVRRKSREMFEIAFLLLCRGADRTDPFWNQLLEKALRWGGASYPEEAAQINRELQKPTSARKRVKPAYTNNKPGRSLKRARGKGVSKRETSISGVQSQPTLQLRDGPLLNDRDAPLRSKISHETSSSDETTHRMRAQLRHSLPTRKRTRRHS